MLHRFLVSLSLVLLGTGTLIPAETPLTGRVGLSLRAAADTNLYLQDEAPLAAGQVRAVLPARADALAFTAAATLETTWKPDAALQLTASYAPEFTRYDRYAQENHTDHRLALGASGRAGAWHGELRANALFTHGSTESPVFNRLGGAPCIGAEPVRARRTQDLYRLTGRLTRELPHGFVRGLVAASRQDFHTAERTAVGYANYADRGETSGGLEAGWNIWKSLALVAGLRAGRQQQANVLGTNLNYTNTLVRWLGGAEGSWGKAWKISVLGGPDERRYGPAVAAGFVRRRRTTYGEGSVAWTPRADDTLTLTGKRYAWLSSGGRSAYVDLVAELGWQHRFRTGWTSLAAFNHHTADTRHFSTTTPRLDSIEAARIGVTRTLGAYAVEATCQHEWSATNIANSPGRIYHREILSFGATRTW